MIARNLDFDRRHAPDPIRRERKSRSAVAAWSLLFFVAFATWTAFALFGLYVFLFG